MDTANRTTINHINAIFYASFGVCLLLYLSTFLIRNSEIVEPLGSTIVKFEPPPNVPTPAKKRRVIPQPPPTTPSSQQVTHILPKIVEEFVITTGGCWPGDVNNEAKHQLPNFRKAEAKSTVVVYVAVTLLLMSLGATLLDFCKAKSELNNANDLHTNKKKPTLTRRCSLADLTVLRHTRKELLRKESFCSTSDRDWKINRPPLRLDED